MYFYVRLHFFEMSSKHSNFVLLFVPFYKWKLHGICRYHASFLHITLIKYAAMWSLTHISVWRMKSVNCICRHCCKCRCILMHVCTFIWLKSLDLLCKICSSSKSGCGSATATGKVVCSSLNQSKAVNPPVCEFPLSDVHTHALSFHACEALVPAVSLCLS